MKQGVSLPSVSVIVPAYNRARIIGETIESLLGQTLAPHQLIVVDDGSDDNTVDVARSFGPRVLVVEQANSGPGSARNHGLELATGEFVQFFDSDDLCTTDKLEHQARALAESGADLAYGPWAHFWSEAGGLRVAGMAVQQGPTRREPLTAMLAGWLAFMPASMVRRSWIDRVGGYPTARRTGEDVELLFRLVLAGARLVHVPGPLLLVRQHGEGQISSASHLATMRAEDQVHLCSEIAAMLQGRGLRLSAGQHLSWRTWQWRVHNQLAQLDPAWPARQDWLAAANQRLAERYSGLRLRLTGSRFGADFAPAPLSKSQRDQLFRMAGNLGLALQIGS